MCILVLRFSHYVATDTHKAVCTHSKHDDNRMNILGFVNFLLTKIFPTVIHQNFPPSKFCAIRYLMVNIVSNYTSQDDASYNRYST